AFLVWAVVYAGPVIRVAAQSGAFVPVTQEMQANPDPADWLHISRTYNQHRFSPLTQINKSNAAQLRMAWSRGLPAGTQESTPIVYRGVMYVMAPGAGIQALDASNGDLIWQYERNYPQGVAARAARSKSLGIYEDMLYFGAPDGFLVALTSPVELYSNSTVALNVETGKLVWYFQELPGDDWDADHNHERILVRTRVSPDPRFVKWINPALTPGTQQDIVVTVAEGGGMFAVAQQTGQFLWARPFPYDDPN